MNDPVVVEQYERMPDDKRRQFLVAHIQDSTDLTERFLLEALAWETDPTSRWFLVKGLGLRHSSSSIPLIVRLCQEPNSDLEHTSLHRICAWSLGKIGEVALSDVMILLRSETPEVRSCAADALGEIGSPLAVSPLCKVLESDNHSVKLWAALSLAKLGKAALTALHDIIDRNQGQVRYLAIDSVLKIGDQESVPIIAGILRSGEKKEKQMILQQGHAFHVSLAITIRDLANTNDKDVANAARAALADLEALQ